MITLYDDNDNLIFLRDMTQASDGSYVNTATVALTLYLTTSGVRAAVSGATSLSGSYVTDSSGDYQVVIPYTVSLTPGGDYEMEITATVGVRRGFQVLPVQVVRRTS